MGRQLTSVDGGRALISWTATMFEYLMPLIVMRNYPETLLSETYESVVNRQIEYGYERGCRGEFPSRLMPRVTCPSTISTGPSVFRVSASSAD
jgi:hypothetical protein